MPLQAESSTHQILFCTLLPNRALPYLYEKAYNPDR
jgi:hypothetical protein